MINLLNSTGLNGSPDRNSNDKKDIYEASYLKHFERALKNLTKVESEPIRKHQLS